MAGRTARERAEREARQRAQAYAVGRAVHEDRARRRRRDNLLGGIVFGIVAVLAILAQVGYVTVGPGAPKPSTSSSASASATPTATATAPSKALAENRTWKGTMTINGAKLTISLNGKKAPQAVASFLYLAEEGYFDGSYCPRMTTKTVYILQCGAKTDSVSATSPYSFGPIENAPAHVKDGTTYGHRVYRTGVLAMARVSDEADSQGSQFFIIYGKDSSFPDDTAGGYTVFGSVTAGLSALKTDVVKKGLTSADASAGDGTPAKTVKISAVKIAG